MKTKQLLVFLFICMLLLGGTAQVASAEGIGPGKAVPSNNGATAMTFYAYKQATEQIAFSFIKSTAAETNVGQSGTLTIKLYSPSGNQVIIASITNVNAINTARTGQTASSEAGIWTFVIEQIGNVSLPFITDINVKTSATGSAIPGRVYTEKLSFLHGKLAGVARANMSTFSVYSVNQQGYRYTSTFYNLYPIYSSFVVNPFGNVLAGTCTSAYKSYSTGDLRYDTGDNCGGGSKIFLNTIAEDVPASAPRFNLTTNTTVTEWLNPAIATENVTGLAYVAGTTVGSAAGSFTFNVINYVGNATLQIDVNNNGLYTDAVDRAIITGVQQGSNTMAFDGKDGSGTAIPCASILKVKLVLDKPGEIHFVLGDAEGLGGIKITRTTGAGSPSSFISWDDRNVSTPKDSYTTPIQGTNVNSSFPPNTVHGWAIDLNADDPNTWGNSAQIDNWAYLPGLTNQEITVTTLCPVPDLTPSLVLSPSTVVGQSKVITARAVILEVKNVATSGDVVVLLPTSSHYTLNTFNASQTFSNGLPVQNNRWTYLGLFGSNYAFQLGGTTNTTSIAGGSSSAFGFSLTYNANGQAGIENIVLSIYDGSGGEINYLNNNDSESVTYSSGN